jgi:hypothetical protein
MNAGKALKIVTAWAVAIAFVMGSSYCSEAPKYSFERVAAETGKEIPGARLIGSMKSRDLMSPISWLWPTTTTWNFASPDPLLQGRFLLVSLQYEESKPDVWLLDVDCDTRRVIWYDLDEPETASPARTVLGGPVVAPNGKTYRRSKVNTALPPEWLHAFCETDWTVERKATAAVMLRSAK